MHQAKIRGVVIIPENSLDALLSIFNSELILFRYFSSEKLKKKKKNGKCILTITCFHPVNILSHLHQVLLYKRNNTSQIKLKSPFDYQPYQCSNSHDH